MNSELTPTAANLTKPRKTFLANLMRPIHQLAGFIFMILKRQRQQGGLTLLSLFSIILTVGLVTNTSFFSRAVDRVILRKELKDFSEVTNRPPFSASVDLIPSNSAPLSVEDAEKFSAQVVSAFTSYVGLPARHIGMQVSSGGMLLLPGANSSTYTTTDNGFLDTIEILYVEGVTPHIEVTEGKAYSEKDTSNGPMDVWMNETIAQKLGLKVGEDFKVGSNLNSSQIDIRVAGFYRPKGRESDFWFSDPTIGLSSVLLTRRNDFIQYLSPILAAKTRGASWYIILEDAEMNPADSKQYLEGYKQSENLLNRLMPGIRLNTAPLDPLSKFVDRSGNLTILLLTYNLPAFLILLFFLTLISSILSRWQRREITLLVSRGMALGGVLNYVLIEQMLLYIPAVPLGVLFGMGVARLMGYTISFLTFIPREALPVNLADISVPLTVAALLVTLISRLWQAVQGSLKSKVVEEREWARSTRAPFWYRAYLDLVLILPTYYFYDQMSKQGTLADLVSKSPDDLFRDPLLILVPALFIVTGSLVVMRLFAILMSLLDVVASLTPWITIHLALRQLSRQSQDYLQPLLLVIISLGMGVYTLSMAASLDQWLIDRIYYKGGADMAFAPVPSGASSLPSDGEFIPAPAEFLKIPGVVSATRVSYLASEVSQGPENTIDGHFMLIDRLDFPSVSWFRSDFADESLGGLMNKLAQSTDSILVPADILSKTNLQIGDSVSATVSVDYDTKITTNFTIAGVYNHFPTVYEEDGFTVIGNMDNISNLLGITVPHHLWFKLKDGAIGSEVLKAVSSAGDMRAIEVFDTRKELTTLQEQSERVGIYGTLTMSFLATAVMAVLGLLIYSYASLRERVYHLAMLLSMGVERGQMIAQVILEYSFLSVFGVAAGAGIGVAATLLFVPFFRFTGEKGVIPLPPLIPIIAWDQVYLLIGIFTAVVVVAETITITLSIRQRIAQLLK
jgi:putative ABC transport system permease protein